MMESSPLAQPESGSLSEILHRAVIEIEDHPLPTGYTPSITITVWLRDSPALEDLDQQARVTAIAFMERALVELRTQPTGGKAQNHFPQPA